MAPKNPKPERRPAADPVGEMASAPAPTPKDEKPYLLRVYTGMSRQQAVSIPIPTAMQGRTLGEAIDYALGHQTLKPEERMAAQGIKDILNGSEAVVVSANDRNVKLEHKLSSMTPKEQEVEVAPGQKETYLALDVEISRAVRGGDNS